MRLFVSYARKDKRRVRKLRQILWEAGFEPWMDLALVPAEHWRARILDEITRCDVFVYILTPASVDSRWCRWEFAQAARQGKPILPVLLRRLRSDQALPPPLEDVQYGDLTGRLTNAGIARLIHGLQVARPIPEEWLVRLEEVLPEAQDTPAQAQWISHTITRLRRWRPPRAALRRAATAGAALLAILCLVFVIVAAVTSDGFGLLGSGAPAVGAPTQQAAVTGTDAPPFTPVPTRPPENTPLPAITPAPTRPPENTPQPTMAPAVDPTVVAARALAEAGVTANAAWTPYTEEINGVEMALVPAGCFMMGSEEYSDEQPIHEVCFEEPFWIDVYEVTNEAFGSVGCAEYSSAPDQPRNCVNWTDALAHCEARGARLPTEAEWEYAARGPDGFVYPWGNTFDCARGNFDDETQYDDYVIEGGEGCDGYVATAPVGSFPGGASWVGAYDLSGNVWEWVNDWYGGYPSGQQVNPQGPGSGESRVVRGGSWLVILTDILRAASRDWGYPSVEFNYFGFRCALSY
jgi:formylglycine-generating enzyme required for sulfatase activity